MKSVSLIGAQAANSKLIENPGVFKLENTKIYVGLIEEEDFSLSESIDPDNRVLVKKKAFSCNYRDKSLIFKYFDSINTAEQKGQYAFSYIGSEFVGEVIDVGKNVTSYAIGDRVIPNISYPYDLTSGKFYRPGLPSNHASRRIDDFFPEKLLKIPEEISDEEAAVFPIAGFTSYSMIRKVVKPGAKILVTAAKSNTSLAVISALRNYDVDVYAMTSSPRYSDVLREMGVKEILVVNHELDSFLDDPKINDMIKGIGAFDAVIDPFYDIHLSRVVELMNYDAKYVTCGFYNQFAPFASSPFKNRGITFNDLLVTVMAKNISIIGNCIGLREDGLKAIEDYQSGRFKIIIDKIFTEGEEADFFDSTYNFKKRLGKVVYKYKE